MHRVMLLALGLLLSAILPLRAEESDADRAARWDLVKQATFGARPIGDGTGIVALDAPARAMDAALVPIDVTVSGARKVKAIYIFVDENPSPMAGTFHFGPAAVPHELKTRVRVEQYTLMHVVAETEDGQLYATSRFVKAAGGCSAPSQADSTSALQEIGRMKLRLPRPPVLGQPVTAELLIRHPNNNGMQMDQITRNYIPARYIQTVAISYNNAKVFDFDADISLSTDPEITFTFLAAQPGDLNVVVKDSDKAVFRKTFDLQKSFEIPSQG
jgi:sulfur-oxidizing protein SoxY